jgi:hypothetical protein
MTTPKDDPLADILNISPVIRENNVVIHQESDASDAQIEGDISYVRDMMYDTIKNTSDAVEEMLQIAKQSQHPRAFEVVATLLNTQREASKDLLDLHKKKKEITKVESSGPGTINNNMFVGSTQDLLKMIKDAKSS